MQSVLCADIKKHRAASGIESHFSVVQLSLLLVRMRQIEAQRFQSFFLLRLDLTIAVFTIEDMALMDVRRRFIEMQRPVQDVDVLTEAALKFFKELRRDLSQNRRRNRLLHRPDLDK